MFLSASFFVLLLFHYPLSQISVKLSRLSPLDWRERKRKRKRGKEKGHQQEDSLHHFSNGYTKKVFSKLVDLIQKPIFMLHCDSFCQNTKQLHLHAKSAIQSLKVIMSQGLLLKAIMTRIPPQAALNHAEQLFNVIAVSTNQIIPQTKEHKHSLNNAILAILLCCHRPLIFLCQAEDL